MTIMLISIAFAFLFSGTKDSLAAIVGSLHRNKQLSIINSSGFYVVTILGMIFIILNFPSSLLPFLIIFAPISQLILSMYFLRYNLKDLIISSVNFFLKKNIKQALIDDFKQFKDILFFGFSVSVGKISFMVMKSLDIPVLILFFNYANVGIYSVADTASSVLFSMTAFSLPILSSISEAWAKQDMELVEDYAKISVKYPLIIGTPLTVIIFALADPIVKGIYGSEFQGAIMPLQILIFGTFLLMFGYTLGFNGAAISLTLTGATTLFLIPIIIRRNLKADIFSGIHKILFSGAILTAILLFIRNINPIMLVLGLAASLIIYVLLLRYTGYLTNEDIELLKAARAYSS
ncbi:MAG: oligosaccharide flippase family protein [Candidatus Bathyarchaeota archaeon]